MTLRRPPWALPEPNPTSNPRREREGGRAGAALCAAALSLVCMAAWAGPIPDPLDSHAPLEGPPVIELTAADEAQLDKSEPVFKQTEAGKGGGGVAIRDIEASPEEVWSRILDFDAYPEMIDSVKECEVYDRDDSTIKTRIVVGAAGMKYEYNIDHTYDASKGHLSWTLDDSRKNDLSSSDGYWSVAPHPTKEGWTRVYYSVDVQVGRWVPGFVAKVLRSQGLKQATEWVKAEAER